MSDSPTPVAFVAPEISTLAPLFPGYEIELLIATGGMGAVYRAVQKSLDRVVAIKILPRELSNDAAFCAGFEAEAKAMARLNHPNLIGVYDFGEVDGMLYIIMEYVPGKSIFHSANGIAIDPGEVIRLVSGVCNGLAHAHENGILHRDIKPSNILLDLNAQPKIGDFGLARPVERKVQEGEEIFGTPHYTAPEVVESPHSVDYRADIFSVGVLLHELLTGRLPAEDLRPASVIANCDARFDVIIRRATNAVPSLRYASAAEITRDLEAIAAATALRGPRNPVPNAPPRPVAKRAVVKPAKQSSSLPGILMLLAAVAIAYFGYSNFKKKQSAVPTVEVIASEEKPEETEKPEPTPSLAIPLPDDNPPGETDSTDAASSQEDMNEDDSSNTAEGSSGNDTPAEPKFDVAGFFERARKIMKEKAAPLMASNEDSLGKNLADYERAMNRLIRKVDSKFMRENAETSLEEFIAEIKQDGNRIPAAPDGDISVLREARATHTEYLEKQEIIDEQLKKSLTQLAATYILGLEKQVERLQGTDDPAAIDLIKEEIANTRDDEDHFPQLMLGDSSE